MGLQLTENKALSWGIIGKSAHILAEITIRESQSSTVVAEGCLDGPHVQEHIRDDLNQAGLKDPPVYELARHLTD